MKELACRLFVVVLAGWAGSVNAALVLNIDLNNQTFDWVDGTSITQIGGRPDNRFGTTSAVADVRINFPLATFVGPAVHSGVLFFISNDGTAIEGLGLGTSGPPNIGSSFSGTADLPATAIFALGNFSNFANLASGSYDLTRVESLTWDGNVIVNVSNVPIPAAAWLFISAIGGLVVAKRRQQSA